MMALIRSLVKEGLTGLYICSLCKNGADYRKSYLIDLAQDKQEAQLLLGDRATRKHAKDS